MTVSNLIENSQLEQLDYGYQPIHPDIHIFTTDLGDFALLVDGSRIYALPASISAKVKEALNSGVESVAKIFEEFCLGGSQTYIDDHPPESPPLRALSLAIAQKCNLGCTYCYAQEGDFGEPARNMSWQVAKKAVESLLSDTEPGDRVNLAFLGGEPLVNRSVLRLATEYAWNLATERNVDIGFSITTNGTLMIIDDCQFFERYGFAVTVSIDGVGITHDQQRAFKDGKGSYERIIERVQPALAIQKNMQVSARVTVTPRNLRLRATLDRLIELGFHSIGFSPMISSPTGCDQMESQNLMVMLEQMIDCGQEFERQVIEGHRYPFSNMTTAMQEIHQGTHRPYPCGAGAGYFGVSAEGGLFACHRFVEDSNGKMGNLTDGIDQMAQHQWLRDRHVHFQEPCNQCWARYLCGGGCHHEVIHRGRPACNYIRGWLHFCLQTYVNLLHTKPSYFGL